MRTGTGIACDFLYIEIFNVDNALLSFFSSFLVYTTTFILKVALLILFLMVWSFYVAVFLRIKSQQKPPGPRSLAPRLQVPFTHSISSAAFEISASQRIPGGSVQDLWPARPRSVWCCIISSRHRLWIRRAIQRLHLLLEDQIVGARMNLHEKKQKTFSFRLPRRAYVHEQSETILQELKLYCSKLSNIEKID